MDNDLDKQYQRMNEDFDYLLERFRKMSEFNPSSFVPFFHNQLRTQFFHNSTPSFLAIYVFDQKTYPLLLDSNQPPSGYESAMLPLSHGFQLYVMCLE